MHAPSFRQSLPPATEITAPPRWVGASQRIFLCPIDKRAPNFRSFRMIGTSARQPSLVDIFRNGNFAKYWVGQFVSYLGDRIDQIAMIAIVSLGVGDTVKADRTIMITFWATLPYVLLSPFAGALIDRYDRRKLMVWTDIFRGCVVLSLPFAISPQTHPYVIYLIIAMIGMATCVFAPAKSAFIPEIVPREHLLRANSVTSTMGTLTMLIGTVVGGIMVDALAKPGALPGFIERLFARSKLQPGYGASLLIDCATYFFSAAMLMWIRMPRVENMLVAARKKEVEAEGGFFANIKDGFYFVSGRRIPGIAVALDSMFFLIGGLLFTAISELAYTRIAPGSSASAGAPGTKAFSFACGSLGLGLAIGGILTGRYGSRLPLYGLSGACFCGASIFTLALCFPGPPWLTYLLLAGVGYSAGGIVVVIETALQKAVPDEIRGRVFALNNLMLNTTLLIGVGIGAILLKKHIIKVDGILIACILLSAVGFVIAYLGFPRRVSLATLKVEKVNLVRGRPEGGT